MGGRECPPSRTIFFNRMTQRSLKKKLLTTQRLQRGIFDPHEDGTEHLILLDAKKDRYNFSLNSEVALEEYEYWEPDMVLVEGKASGLPLADELMRINIPVVRYILSG